MPRGSELKILERRGNQWVALNHPIYDSREDAIYEGELDYLVAGRAVVIGRDGPKMMNVFFWNPPGEGKPSALIRAEDLHAIGVVT